MAEDGAENKFLAPAAVTALKQQAKQETPAGVQMERSISQDIREEREDLKEAAEQTLNVILDLGLDGHIRWVSPSWAEVVGTPLDSVRGKPIADFVLDNPSAFRDAVESMKKDDSKSQIIRFSVRMGPNSVLKSASEQEKDGEDGPKDEGPEVENFLNLEGQGIMVYDRASGGESHTMWMLRPSSQPREVTIDLPPLIVESLGVGAEMLANYLTSLAEVGANDPAHHPPPMPILCRICERQITPWWFEKHSDLCVQEHKAEMDVQTAQENLNEHRNAIVKVLDALQARKSRPASGDSSPAIGPQAEYNGLPIGPSSTPSSGLTSGTSSSPGTPPRSRDASASGLGPARARSFAVRRPLSRKVELVLDLCDTALEISTPAIKEAKNDSSDDFRTQSPQSESRISQVLQWQSPSKNTLEQEQGLAALCADTDKVARGKVEAVLRHRRILEYSERIRVEFTVLVEECIAAAIRKAQQIAAGDVSDSSSGDEAEADAGEAPEEAIALSQEEAKVPQDLPRASSQEVLSALTASLDGSSAIASALRNASDPSLASQAERRSSSVAVSTRSNSPVECPTPRSHKSAAGLLSQSQLSKRNSIYVESDPGDSDSSVPSSILSGPWRTESPASEHGLSRAASARDRKRKSLILPGLSSPRRNQSPGRNPPPHSPLRTSKPRLPSGESMPSPVTSPLLTTGEFMAPGIAAHHHHHHRRQSSAHSSDLAKPPVSPRLTSVSHPQPRAVAPSIKDFEIIKPISKGAFGSVYLSKKKTTGEYFAIKVLKKTDMVAKNQVTNVKAERAIMMWQGESDFVAKLYWTFSSKDYLYLVMEYLNGGDCASLVKILGGLPGDWAKKYIAEVVLGVEHLHSRGIVHRDLKPDNLLIDQKGHLKLTDFGLSRMGLVGRQKRILKDPNESAPDLLKQGPFHRAMSMASSRSASFDFQGSQSPCSTPLMTPSLAGGLDQPSYFNLNRESSLSREHSRRTSGYRSDSGGSDALHSMFRTFSLNEQPEMPQPTRSRPIEEETHSEGSGSPDLYALQPATSHPSQPGEHNTPPQQPMLPPPMALFDPEDHNRLFVGTPDYLAPETINGIGQDEMSDWWSLGCILFEFLYGYPPFNADTPDRVFENILQRKINWPEDEDFQVSPEAKDLMNKLIMINPQDRIGANLAEKFSSGGAEIKSHPWFSDVNWETLLEDEAQFVPAPENPEDTEYFDARGATLQAFAEEMEDQTSPQGVTPGADYPDRPHDALSRVRSQVNSMKRGLMPLHIPPHVRDLRSRRLSEPVITDDFGNFAFKNLPVLEKANKDVIQKLRAEAMQAQSKPPSSVNTPTSNSPGPSLEGSPILPMPLKRALSVNRGHNRPASPSGLSLNNASPSRPSQPSSPLLVQFSTGQNHERRKTSSKASSASSTLSHHSSSSLQPGSFFDPPRLSTNFKIPSAASSPIKSARVPAISPEKAAPGQRQSSVETCRGQSSAETSRGQSSVETSRARSHTVGSQEGDLRESYIPGHYKRKSQIFDVSPSSSDNEDPRAKAILRVQRRRQSSRRLSQITLADGPMFRPLDVLICDDHPVAKMVMERLLEKIRCRTITATNGSEATRYALSDIQFDIILMEYKLPQVNGADVARMIRLSKSANSQTPIIAVTGYLKELPETHNFDALIEKMPTLAKITETLCTWCQWKPPPKDFNPSHSLAIPPSGLRQESVGQTDSPSSTSSAFAPMPESSYRGSSREDSIGSSFFDDLESVKAADDHVPVIISRQATDDWGGDLGGNGLGISEEVVTDTKRFIQPSFPHLIHTTSAPPSVNTGIHTPRKQRSIEGIKAKRESLEKKRYECAESGDDEDDELGDVQVRARSPQGKALRGGSKLGTEMMRTNSRGSVVSGSEELIRKEKESGIADVVSPLPMMFSPDNLEEQMDSLHIEAEPLSVLPEGDELEEQQRLQPRPTLEQSSSQVQGHITPPVIFPKLPGADVKEIDMDADITPEPQSIISDFSEEPTPRASGPPSVK